MQPVHTQHCEIRWRLCAYNAVGYLKVCGGIQLPKVLWVCVIGVLFVLGNVVSIVHDVVGMHVWLCGSVYGNIICGFVLAVQVCLVCVIVLNPSLGVWDICFLFGAAHNAVSSGHGKQWVQVGSLRSATIVVGLGVLLCDAFVANG